MDSLGISIIEKLLSGLSARQAVLESLGFVDSADYEAIKNDRDLYDYSGDVALFYPEAKLVSSNPHYSVYQFQVYSPTLIGKFYDADDAHPLFVNVPLKAGALDRLVGFNSEVKQYFDSGEDFRTFLTDIADEIYGPVSCELRR